MLYADDAGFVSRSPEGLARMTTIIVEVFAAFGLTVSEKKTETMLMRGGCLKKFSRELFDRQSAPWRLKVRLLKAGAMEALLYGCMTWAPRADHYALLRTTHHRLLLRVIGYRRVQGTYQQLSYAKALEKTGSQCVEAIIRQRRLLFVGALARQDDGRLPKRLMFGKLVGVPWYAGVVKGAARFMTAWHKEEKEASRKRAGKRTERELSTTSKEKTEEEEEEKGEGEARGSKRRKTRKDETTAAEESKRELMERVARHMHQID
ncbi:unnamed protein product [Pylaiella littoralis]